MVGGGTAFAERRRAGEDGIQHSIAGTIVSAMLCAGISAGPSLGELERELTLTSSAQP